MRNPLLWAVVLLFTACGPGTSRKAVESTAPSNGVEVLSFHTKKRCPTCVAVERLTREVIEGNFAAQLADGRLVFRTVDISQEEALADKYEVAWSSLLVCEHKDGAEHVNNLTKFAFANARTNPEKFKAELKTQIEKLLDK